MTTHELLKEQLDDSGYQLDKAYEGMPEQGMDYKATEGCMSPREQLGHLMEAYEAYIQQTQGKKYDWGSFTPASSETGPLLAEFRDQRAKAAAAALASDSDEMIKSAHMYVIGHDYYHVGQVCLALLAVEPGWDPYAIYRG